jgi:hypothetical protein
MKIRIGILFLLVAIGLQSCVVSSLHPLYTDSSRVHIDNLDGFWIEDGELTYEITTIVDTTGLHSKKKKNKNGMSKEEAFFYGKTKANKSNNPRNAKIERFFFNSSLKKHYEIKMYTKKDTAIFDGVLVKLDGNYFLDITVNDDYLEGKLSEEVLLGCLVNTHLFYRLEYKDDMIYLYSLEDEDFNKFVDRKKARIEYTKIKDKILITSTTKDLQKFLIKLSNTKYFSDPENRRILKRKK